tara:strand:+ start:200146 stop:202488 length:2343 start_codon:yes stop_codon:yes gene_type:complete
MPVSDVDIVEYINKNIGPVGKESWLINAERYGARVVTPSIADHDAALAYAEHVKNSLGGNGNVQVIQSPFTRQYRVFVDRSFMQELIERESLLKEQQQVFENAVRQATSFRDLALVIEGFKGEIIDLDGRPIDNKPLLGQTISKLEHDVSLVSSAAEEPELWLTSMIPPSYGIQKKLIELCRVKNFENKIKDAAKPSELYTIISTYNGDIKSSNGVVLDKFAIVNGIQKVLNDKDSVKNISENENAFPFSAYGISRSNGIKDKVIALAKQQHAINLQALAQAQAQQRPLPPLPSLPEQANSAFSPPAKKGLLDVSERDWQKAEQFFTRYPNQTKFGRKDPRNGIEHSFINVNGTIYAKKTGEAVGEGNFGKVKIVQNRAGENFAVKVEGRSVRGQNDPETKILTILGELQGEADRAYGKNFKGRYASNKLYTVMKLQEGHELHDELYFDKDMNQRKNTLSPQQRLMAAIKSAEAIDHLHQHRIIHADIKPQNFMANVKGDMITVGAIDFGFSMILEEGRSEVNDKAKGSPIYIAPEIARFDDNWNCTYAGDPAKYSFASDVYALGMMFKEDFQLDLGNEFYEKLLNESPSERPDMSQLLSKLCAKLEEQPNLSAQAKETIYEHKKPALDIILSKGLQELNDQYEGKSKSRANSNVGKWASNMHKKAGKSLFGKGKKREDQLAKINDAIQTLNKSELKDLSDKDKAEFLYAVLTDIEEQIGAEHNTHRSGMAEMVGDYKQALAAQFKDNLDISPANILEKLQLLEAQVEGVKSERSSGLTR